MEPLIYTKKPAKQRKNSRATEKISYWRESRLSSLEKVSMLLVMIDGLILAFMGVRNMEVRGELVLIVRGFYVPACALIITFSMGTTCRTEWYHSILGYVGVLVGICAGIGDYYDIGAVACLITVADLVFIIICQTMQNESGLSTSVLCDLYWCICFILVLIVVLMSLGISVHYWNNTIRAVLVLCVVGLIEVSVIIYALMKA